MIRSIDLAYMAGKKRQSPRTGLVHGSDLFSDVIPLYDNFCFIYALLSQRKAETVLEAKALLLRLLAFQGGEGNFPIHLHDFPTCYDGYMGLRIAPLLLRSLKGYGTVLGSECREFVEAALQKIFFFYEEKKLPPLWAFRYQVCLGNTTESVDPNCSDLTPDLWEYWVSLQFLRSPSCAHYYPVLGLIPELVDKQDHFEPVPHLIEWACAAAAADGGVAYPARLLRDHPNQIRLAALDKVELTKQLPDSFLLAKPFKLYWIDQNLHTLDLVADPDCISAAVDPQDPAIFITLPQSAEFGRDDLVELAFFCDASPLTQIRIADRQGTVFKLGDPVRIATPSFQCTLCFELIKGVGDFCGHITRSNRPNQIGCVGSLQYEAFDWKIALRTLRRSDDCVIRVRYSFGPVTDLLSTAIPMA